MKQDEFYIGWQDSASTKFKNGRKKFFVLGLLLMMIFPATYLFLEDKFVDNYFDYGNLTELEGTVVEYPVFGLKTEIDGKEVTVPLVGFGKFDALPVLNTLKEKLGSQELSLFTVKLRGTLMTYQDKTWMELTEGDQSILEVSGLKQKVSQKISQKGSEKIMGEIVDPKCFFGVMNPAYEKIHRSCAIRCISGGIPPVLATRKDGEFVDYYFVTNNNGQPINEQILQYVGIPLVLSGNVEQVDDWKVIKVNPELLASSALQILDDQIAYCGL